jgi:hypothetical protein
LWVLLVLQKLKKEMDQAVKQYNTLKQKLETNPHFLEALKVDLKEVEDKIANVKIS